MLPALCTLIDPAHYKAIVITRDWHPIDHVSFSKYGGCP